MTHCGLIEQVSHVATQIIFSGCWVSYPNSYRHCVSEASKPFSPILVYYVNWSSMIPGLDRLQIGLPDAPRLIKHVIVLVMWRDVNKRRVSCCGSLFNRSSEPQLKGAFILIGGMGICFFVYKFKAVLTDVLQETTSHVWHCWFPLSCTKHLQPLHNCICSRGMMESAQAGVEIWWKIRTGPWFSTPQHHTVSMNLKIPTTIKPLKLNCTIAQKADERAEAFRWKRRWRSCRWISRSLSSKDHLTSALCWTPWFIFIKLTYELNSNLIWQKNIY